MAKKVVKQEETSVKKTKSQVVYEKYLDKMSGFLTSNNDASKLLEQLSQGKNSYLKMDRVQSSSFDTTWLDEIEGVILDLGEIVANPRSNTKIVTDIIPVELARKTNAESVQHLASHTQFIKDIDEEGNARAFGHLHNIAVPGDKQGFIIRKHCVSPFSETLPLSKLQPSSCAFV